MKPQLGEQVILVGLHLFFLGFSGIRTQGTFRSVFKNATAILETQVTLWNPVEAKIVHNVDDNVGNDSDVDAGSSNYDCDAITMMMIVVMALLW